MSLSETLQTWLKIDSTSGREESFLNHLQDYFLANRWNVDRQEVAPRRFNLIVTAKEAPDLLFSTHVDTVPPHLPVRFDGDLIFGRGACDTKGGLLAMVNAAETLRSEGREKIGFLLVVGEEVDHCGAKKAAELSLRPKRIILCEPTENQVVAAQKGMLKFALSSTGVAGHSAYPDRGRSALEPLLDTLERIRRHSFPEDSLLGPTTVNIGKLNAGVAANVFAPEARAELLIRAVSPVDDLLETIRALLHPEVRLETPVSNNPVFFDPPEGFATTTVPFNTDASYLNGLAPVWLVGPGDIRVAHGDNEHIRLDDLRAGIDLYIRLGREALS